MRHLNSLLPINKTACAKMPFAHDDDGVLPAHDLREVGALAVYTTAQGSSELRLNTGLPAIARGRGWVTTSEVAPGALVLQQKSGKLGKHSRLPGDVVTLSSLTPSLLAARRTNPLTMVRQSTSTCKCAVCAAAPASRKVVVIRLYTLEGIRQGAAQTSVRNGGRHVSEPSEVGPQIKAGTPYDKRAIRGLREAQLLRPRQMFPVLGSKLPVARIRAISRGQQRAPPSTVGMSEHEQLHRYLTEVLPRAETGGGLLAWYKSPDMAVGRKDAGGALAYMCAL